MKKEAAAEVGWLEDRGAAGPYGTELLCLDEVTETVETDVSEGIARVWLSKTQLLALCLESHFFFLFSFSPASKEAPSQVSHYQVEQAHSLRQDSASTAL
ncbi:hypothetical protein MHYP_G00135960 [Metynnis hypsauchen]